MIRLDPDDPTADWTVPGVYEVDPGLYRIPLPLHARVDELLDHHDTRLGWLDVLSVAGQLRRTDLDRISHYAQA